MTPQVRKPITEPFARIDGLPVAVAIVNDYLGLAADFAAAFPGIRLVVYSGIRTYEDQVRIFKERYTTTPGGRRVYDVRRWQGVLWYRISPVGTVAQPGSSNHESGRALDLRDTGSDPGVASSFLTPRNIWLSRNCGRYGFTHTGRNFAEPWHVEHLACPDPWGGLGKPLSILSSNPGQPLTTSTGGGSITPNTSEEDDMTPEESTMLREIRDALLKDGKKQADWSLAHKIDHTNRMLTKPVVDSPGGPQSKWSLFHSVSWLMRQVAAILDQLNGKK